jgi:protein-L-isoaspartate(D-aspartate) O-methyltransferase
MYEKERLELAEALYNKGIRDKATLKAILKVERHLFVAQGMQYHAYKDTALYIGRGQTISQPYTVAYMTEKLNLKPGDTVLEIGTGSGYQAAILLEMGMRVYTIERSFELYQEVVALFDRLHLHILARCGDGTIGWNEFAPYNGIIVTAGSPSIPESLKRQLAIGGRLIVPVGDRNTQTMHIITRVDQDRYETELTPDFQFVPLVGKEGWKTE